MKGFWWHLHVGSFQNLVPSVPFLFSLGALWLRALTRKRRTAVRLERKGPISQARLLSSLPHTIHGSSPSWSLSLLLLLRARAKGKTPQEEGNRQLLPNSHIFSLAAVVSFFHRVFLSPAPAQISFLFLPQAGAGWKGSQGQHLLVGNHYSITIFPGRREWIYRS